MVCRRDAGFEESCSKCSQNCSPRASSAWLMSHCPETFQGQGFTAGCSAEGCVPANQAGRKSREDQLSTSPSLVTPRIPGILHIALTVDRNSLWPGARGWPWHHQPPCLRVLSPLRHRGSSSGLNLQASQQCQLCSVPLCAPTDSGLHLNRNKLRQSTFPLNLQ